MGITYDVFDFFHKTVNKVGWDLKGKNICDLGNQIFYGKRMFDYAHKNFKKKITTDGKDYYFSVRDYYESLGMTYTSIDLNGIEGALQINLEKPIKDKNLLGKFDIVTNYGMSEHILNDKVCFDSIHNLCKPYGLMVHVVPELPKSPDQPHGYHSYPLTYFDTLAKKRGYKIIDSGTLDCAELDEYTVWKISLVSLQRGGQDEDTIG